MARMPPPCSGGCCWARPAATGTSPTSPPSPPPPPASSTSEPAAAPPDAAAPAAATTPQPPSCGNGATPSPTPPPTPATPAPTPPSTAAPARITDTVRALQTRADTAPGRWQRGGGPADRRVLDTLHTLALTAVTAEIEADTRRIALTAGIGRETARVALHRLTTDGWIRQTRQAAGVHGATWTIDPTGILHNLDNTARSQAATRPAGAGAAERTLLTRELEQRTALARHDTFSCNHALPHSAGNRYARLSPTRPTPATNAADLDDLERLRQHGLVQHSPHGWTRAPDSLRDRIATRLGINGRLETRKHRYLAERDVWSWWQAEHDWMRTPRTQRDRRSPATQVPLWQTPGDSRYPRHPRRPDGRADYAAARTAHTQGALHAPALAA